jgi:hypothetical protein
MRVDRDEVVVDASGTYSMVGVRSFGRGLFRRPVISGAGSSYSKFYRLRTGQVVFSRLFGWEGAVAVVPAEFDGLLVSPEFPTLTIDQSVAFPPYLSHFVRWAEFHNQLLGVTRGLGQRRKRVNVEDFLGLEMSLPALENQRHIAAELDRLSDVAAKAGRLSARAGEINAALAVSVATRPDLGDYAKAAGGWSKVPLRDALESSGVTTNVQPSERYQIAGIYSFGRGLIDRGWITGAETSYSTLTRVQTGDIVLSKLNGWEGAIAVVDAQFDGFFVSSEYPVFAPRPRVVTSDYFAGLAASPDFWRALDESARGSMVRRRRISPTEFLATEVWLPPMGMQLTVARRLASLRELANVRRTAAARMGALVPSALNAAFGPQR